MLLRMSDQASASPLPVAGHCPSPALAKLADRCSPQETGTGEGNAIFSTARRLEIKGVPWALDVFHFTSVVPPSSTPMEDGTEYQRKAWPIAS